LYPNVIIFVSLLTMGSLSLSINPTDAVSRSAGHHGRKKSEDDKEVQLAKAKTTTSQALLVLVIEDTAHAQDAE
jgi:hypothetical protein